MKGTPAKVSTLRGTFWILFFFCILFCIPFLITQKKYHFESKTEESTKSPQFPLDVKLVVFRDTNKIKSSTRSKVTLKDLIKDDTGLILVNFWATWCPPCLEELPSIEMLHRQIQNKTDQIGSPNLKLITISVDDHLDDISKLESTLDFKPSFNVLYDREGELARSIGTTKFPETYLINKEGKILYKWLGPQNWLSHDVLQQLKNHAQ